MLTIHLLTKNKAKLLEKTLESLTPLDFKIIVGDLGNDNTSDICEKFNAKYFRINNNDYSKTRNDLVDISNTDWQMYIEPGEIFSGYEQLLLALRQKEDAYRLYHIQGEILNKPLRLWKKSSGRKFTRPVYESLEPETDNLLECFISGGTSDPEEKMNLLLEWEKKNPHAADIEYYKAFTYLACGHYDHFLSHANTFLFRTSQNSHACLLTRYYVASVMLKIKKNTAECIKQITYCLAEYPTMAEFWCLLGDCFVKMQQNNRASSFYENAILFGKRRINDSLPIEISKYKEYPEKMLTQIQVR